MLKFFKAPVIWAILIWAFSSIPNTELPNFSFWRILSGDKLIHIFLYGVLSFLLVGSSLKQHMYRRIRYNASPFTLIATSVYGVLIELYQEFVLTDRYGDWADALANFAGAFLGLILFRSIFRDYIR
ncbi:MAG: VanZ family protein [Bacteroidota bacterium]|jgi:VanZ family protein